MTDDDVVKERALYGGDNCTHTYVDPISRSIRKNDFLDNCVAYLSSFSNLANMITTEIERH
jgi:hypothetical protein